MSKTIFSNCVRIVEITATTTQFSYVSIGRTSSLLIPGRSFGWKRPSSCFIDIFSELHHQTLYSAHRLTQAPTNQPQNHFIWLDRHTHTYLSTYMCVCMHVCMYVCMHACMHTCMHVCMHACMYVCVCVCVCTYIHIYIIKYYIYIYNVWWCNSLKMSIKQLEGLCQPKLRPSIKAKQFYLDV